MTSGGEGEFGLFRVSYLASARGELPGLFQEAASLGIRPGCVSSLKKIERRLRLDPLEFGELVGERRVEAFNSRWLISAFDRTVCN